MRQMLALLSLILTAACGNGTVTASDGSGSGGISDATLSAAARQTSGWTYYKLRPDTLVRAQSSGHSEARLRTRYNAIAAALLDASGKVRPGASFPDSSLIVKELLVGNRLSRYAVMYKLRGSPNAGTGGWLWAYYAPDGSTQIGIGARGASCISCHASGIDQTRMNDSHP
ncbi:MAG: hypothetical protein ACK6DR_18680 [Gemmatimonas sp.]|jgi:hypothetical protein|uniref:hypothetical protein n=1 Tax=Gemmatimonas sp. TaxID=1962908 RepID=UPI00391B5528